MNVSIVYIFLLVLVKSLYILNKRYLIVLLLKYLPVYDFLKVLYVSSVGFIYHL